MMLRCFPSNSSTSGKVWVDSPLDHNLSALCRGISRLVYSYRHFHRAKIRELTLTSSGWSSMRLKVQPSMRSGTLQIRLIPIPLGLFFSPVNLMNCLCDDEDRKLCDFYKTCATCVCRTHLMECVLTIFQCKCVIICVFRLFH